MVATGGEAGRGINLAKNNVCPTRKQRNEHPNVAGVFLSGAGTALRLERDAWSMVK